MNSICRSNLLLNLLQPLFYILVRWRCHYVDALDCYFFLFLITILFSPLLFMYSRLLFIVVCYLYSTCFRLIQFLFYYFTIIFPIVRFLFFPFFLNAFDNGISILFQYIRLLIGVFRNICFPFSFTLIFMYFFFFVIYQFSQRNTSYVICYGFVRFLWFVLLWRERYVVSPDIKADSVECEKRAGK